MIPAEELSKMDPRANTKSEESSSAAGEGRVDKPISAVGATSIPGMPCAAEGTEYFTKCDQKQTRKKRGQPPRLDERLKALVVKLVSRRMSYRDAARHAEIDHSTISRAAQRDSTFAAALKEAKRLGKLRPRLGIQGWRQAVAVLKASGFDPQWTRGKRSC